MFWICLFTLTMQGILGVHFLASDKFRGEGALITRRRHRVVDGLRLPRRRCFAELSFPFRELYTRFATPSAREKSLISPLRTAQRLMSCLKRKTSFFPAAVKRINARGTWVAHDALRDHRGGHTCFPRRRVSYVCHNRTVNDCIYRSMDHSYST